MGIPFTNVDMLSARRLRHADRRSRTGCQDGAEKTALRIDLWTKEMMIDEMTDFFYQTLMTMADTYDRATQHQELVEEMKKFAHEFYHKSREKQMQENKA